MRIRLASWYGDHKPGDEIDADGVLLKALRRDGRVAEIVETPTEEPPAARQEKPAQPAPVVEQPAASAAETGRKRR